MPSCHSVDSMKNIHGKRQCLSQKRSTALTEHALMLTEVIINNNEQYKRILQVSAYHYYWRKLTKCDTEIQLISGGAQLSSYESMIIE